MSRPAGRKRRPRRGGETIGLVVEGDAEFAALPKLANVMAGCPPLRPVNLYGVGSNTSVDGIARKIAPKIQQHKLAKRHKVVVCIDREQRAECVVKFAVAVRNAISVEMERRGWSDTDVILVVADRTFEAWILSGAEALYDSRHFVRRPSFRCFEGSMGQNNKKGVVELGLLLGRDYSKTVDGPRLFQALDFAKARAWRGGGSGSRSLDKLLRALGI